MRLNKIQEYSVRKLKDSRITAPKSEYDFERIFELTYIYKRNLKITEEDIKLLPILVEGIKDKEGKVILYDQIPFRKYL